MKRATKIAIRHPARSGRTSAAKQVRRALPEPLPDQQHDKGLDKVREQEGAQPHATAMDCRTHDAQPGEPTGVDGDKPREQPCQHPPRTLPGARAREPRRQRIREQVPTCRSKQIGHTATRHKDRQSHRASYQVQRLAQGAEATAEQRFPRAARTSAAG